MRFSVLGSGSAGNATLVARGDQGLLIDCGLTVRELERRLALVDFPPSALIAIVLTHEHDDHIAGAAALSRKYRIPILTTGGTERAAAARLVKAYGIDNLLADRSIEVGPFTLTAVLVPHDAREPCQFVLSDGEWRFGILTDVGQITAHLLREFADLDALVLEFNHDVELLAASAYPPYLRARIGGPYGHLSNLQASRLLEQLDLSRLRTLVAAHLSENTNRPALVAACLRARVPAHASWHIAHQQAPLPWCEVGATIDRHHDA
jgi:phosphoribosyl 1,2-cyclic phosphodiesterase